MAAERALVLQQHHQLNELIGPHPTAAKVSAGLGDSSQPTRKRSAEASSWTARAGRSLSRDTRRGGAPHSLRRRLRLMQFDAIGGRVSVEKDGTLPEGAGGVVLGVNTRTQQEHQ